MTFLYKLRKRLNQTHTAVLAFVIFVAIGLLYLFLYALIFDFEPNSVSYSNTNFNVLNLSIPAHLDFCGEVIPTDDYEVKGDLEKEFFSTSHWKTNSFLLFHKAQRWFPYIEPILKQEGVPDDFKYLAVIESHLSNVQSSAGAAGFWQLVASSALNYGLEVSDQVDERYHVEKATHAACAHIKEAHKIFNNWTLAAAAYNRGINGLIKAMKDQQTSSYHELLLNKETGSFVYRILAYKTLLSSPAHFGLKKKRWSNFSKIPYKVIKIDSSITDLAYLAKALAIPQDLIRQHNPWLLKNSLSNPERKVYEFKIPKNIKVDYSSYLNDLLVDRTVAVVSGTSIGTADSLAKTSPTNLTGPEAIKEVTKTVKEQTLSVPQKESKQK